MRKINTIANRNNGDRPELCSSMHSQQQSRSNFRSLSRERDRYKLIKLRQSQSIDGDSIRSQMIQNINNLQEQYEHLQKSLISQRTKRSMILSKAVPKSKINLLSYTECKSKQRMQSRFQVIPIGHQAQSISKLTKSNKRKGINLVRDIKKRRFGIKVVSSKFN